MGPTLGEEEWLTHTLPELVMAHMKIERATYDAIPKDKVVNMPEQARQPFA